jgi:hypothetical protein
LGNLGKWTKFVEEKKTLSNTSKYSNPLYNHTLGDHFFCVTLMNCDLNVYSHIPCELLQDCDYRPEKEKEKKGLLMLE